MAFRSLRVDRVYCVRWSDAPTEARLDAVLAELEAARAATGTTLLYVTLLSPGLPVPDGPARAALDRFAKRAEPLVAHAWVAVEGSGFRTAIHRSVLTGLHFFKRRAAPATVVASGEEALRQAAARFGIDAEATGAALRREGLLG